MPKNIDLVEILKTISVDEDQQTINRFIEKIVQNYPEKAAKLAKELKLKEEFDDLNAYITTARPLSNTNKAKLEAAFQSKYSYNMNFVYQIDPEILGGIVIKKGEVVIENTLRARADKLIKQIELTDLTRGKDEK